MSTDFMNTYVSRLHPKSLLRGLVVAGVALASLRCLVPGVAEEAPVRIRVEIDRSNKWATDAEVSVDKGFLGVASIEILGTGQVARPGCR